MTARSDRHYVRVYHDDLMRDYPGAWSDDTALATWLRLLVIADKMWPALAELPRSVRPRALRALVAAGLVELVGAHGYRIRGLDAERSQRRDAARNAAASRWHGAESMPNTESEPSHTDTEEVPPFLNRSAGRAKAEPADPWGGWEPRWMAFRFAMAERGLRMPPTEAQRATLWPIIDARPTDAASWLREAPAGAKMAELVRHVLDRWQALRAAVPPDPPATPRPAPIVARVPA